MISRLNLFVAVCMLSSMFALEDPTNVCATGSELEDAYGVLNAAVTVTWEDSNPSEGCGADEVEDCDGTGECWPANWIGDGYPDCEDQEYDCDLTCYTGANGIDCDGGDCLDECGVCDGDGPSYECWNGIEYCTEEDCPEEVEGCTDSDALNYDENANSDDGSCEYPEECDEGEVHDCNGNCVDATLLENGICNDGTDGLADFNCPMLYFDGDG